MKGLIVFLIMWAIAILSLAFGVYFMTPVFINDGSQKYAASSCSQNTGVMTTDSCNRIYRTGE